MTLAVLLISVINILMIQGLVKRKIPCIKDYMNLYAKMYFCQKIMAFCAKVFHTLFS